MRRKLEQLLGLLLLGMALLPLTAHWAANDNSRNLANHNYGKNLMNTLEPNSIFMTEGGDNQVFTSAYNQMAEFLRPDVRMYDQKGNVFYRIYGDFRYMSMDEIDIKRDIVDFEIFSRGRPVYLTWQRNPSVAVCGDWFLKPYGILYKVTPLKYRILVDLAADREFSFARAHNFIVSYYQPKAVMDKLKKNARMIDNYKTRVLQERVHFIGKEEQTRLTRAIFAYEKYLSGALTRVIDQAFSRRLLQELAQEGFLRLEGNQVVFVKDIPRPLPVQDYWKAYKFAYKSVPNAIHWDYLTREILANYNFYFANHLRRRISVFQRQLKYYQKQGAGVKTAELRKKIRDHNRELEECYKNASRYGHDMTPIQHNLGVYYHGQHRLEDARQAFRRGMQSDEYSFISRLSYILVSLELAVKKQDGALEKRVVEEGLDICHDVYRRLKTLKKPPQAKSDWYKKRREYRQFRQLERTMLLPRRQTPLSAVLKIKQALNKKPDNVNLRIRYMQVLHARGQKQGVIQAFEQAPQSKWDSDPMVYYYAFSLQRNNQVNKAVEALNQATAGNNTLYRCLLGLGQIQDYVLRDKAKAIAAYERLLALEPAVMQQALANQGKKAYQDFLNARNFARNRIKQLQR